MSRYQLNKVPHQILRIKRHPFLPSEQDKSLINSSTIPLNPKQFMAQYVSSTSVSRKSRYRMLQILRYIKEVIKLINNGNGLFVNTINYEESMSSLQELLLFFAGDENKATSEDIKQPPDARQFLSILRYCKVPAYLLRFLTQRLS